MRQGYKKLLRLIPTIIIVSIVIVFLISNEKKEETVSAVSQMKDVELSICTEEDYLAFTRSVNEGNSYEDYKVVLLADLDFSDYEQILPIGTVGEEGTAFLGTFEGNGHKISNVKMNVSGGYAGLFANLGGIVKNLHIENSDFSGRVCGAIAADTTDAVILNCEVEAEVSGEIAGVIAGRLDGNVINCVASSENFVAELQRGELEYCYQKGTEDIDGLNKNLSFISGYYEDTEFCRWESDGLSEKKADLLESVTARLSIGGVELKLSSYYSRSNRAWCIVLPALYGNAEVFLEAKTSQSGYESFSRNPEEETMIFTWEDRYYPISFLCADNIDTLYVTLQKQKTLEDIHGNKTEEVPGVITVLEASGDVDYAELKGFYGHGNDSWEAEKKSYNLKMESYVDLLGMGANDDFVLVAGYRDNSLMSYVTTTELVQEIGFEYAPEFRMVNLYVAGAYVGVYFLVEKIEIDQNRIEIDSVYENAKESSHIRLDSFEYSSWKDEDGKAERYFYNVSENPEDITGGYLLEGDVADYSEDDSRFVSDRTVKMTLKRARYSSKEQMDYIADYWQEFEDALFAEDGYNALGKYYSEYIDMESFAMQWLMYELEQEGSLSSSIYFYKESEVTGDGLLHACFPWDMEHSYLMQDLSEDLWIVGKNAFRGYWDAIYMHEDFRAELSRVWEEKFVPALEKMLAEEPKEYESGLKNLSWYQFHIIEIHQLENSRWETMYPWNRCGEIKEFLSVRLTALSEKLKQ